MDAVFWVLISVLVVVNVLATRKCWRRERLPPSVRAALILAVWLLPLFGAIWVLVLTELTRPVSERVRIVYATRGAGGGFGRGTAGAAGAFWVHASGVVDVGGGDGAQGSSHFGGGDGAHCSGDSGGGCHGGGDGGGSGDCGGGGGDGGGGGCH